MKHRKCNGNIVIDLSSMYVISSPSINITTKGISPGIVQIDANPDKKLAKLVCSKCGDILSNKEDLENEILGTCSVCGEDFSPSNILVTDYISMICEDCLNSKKEKIQQQGQLNRNILSLYGEVLKKTDNSTLLTILMKKQ